METNNKARIYNVIILDKSGSMSTIQKEAIIGVNETLGGIRSNQLRDPEQDNHVTLVAFCGCEIRTIYDNVPIAEVHDISSQDYRPCCMTPLYDAVGTTITKLHETTKGERAAYAVTIITDGYENASREYNGAAIKKLIEGYKAEGWMFAYIGADHDVEAVAERLSINNTMAFDKTEAGTQVMFERERKAKSKWARIISAKLKDSSLSPEELADELTGCAKGYF